MAMTSSNHNTNYYNNSRQHMGFARPVLASCYATSKSCSTGVQGFHYSSTSADGMFSPSISYRGHLLNCDSFFLQGHSGAPEASSGYPTSPSSSNGGRRNGAAASHGKGASRIIAKECERLLCRDMTRIFLGGGNDPKSVPVPMISVNSGKNNNHYSSGVDAKEKEMQFIEVWDYVGGASFRGFVAEKGVEKSLFLFFEHVEGTQLKHGLIALIELASECFGCDRLVICLDRKTDRIHSLIRDLGWVGFELITLSHWLQSDSIASPRAMAPIVFPPTPPSNYSPTNTRSGSFSSVSSTSSSIVDEEVTSDRWIFVGMEL